MDYDLGEGLTSQSDLPPQLKRANPPRFCSVVLNFGVCDGPYVIVEFTLVEVVTT